MIRSQLALQPIHFTRALAQGRPLAGQVALVTGGSRGVGRAMTFTLTAAGATVVTGARGSGELSEMRAGVIESLRAIGHPDPESALHVLPGVDISKPGDLRALAEFAKRQGRIDILVNNVGSAGVELPMIDMPLGGWDGSAPGLRTTLMTNLITNIDLTDIVVPGLLATWDGTSPIHGSILNVSSYYGGERNLPLPYANRGDYGIAKLSQQVLAEVFAPFINPVAMNAIAPGPIDGPRLRGMGGAPGLFERRAALIRDSRATNGLYQSFYDHFDNGAVSRTTKVLAALGITQIGSHTASRTLLDRLVEKGRITRERAGELYHRVARLAQRRGVPAVNALLNLAGSDELQSLHIADLLVRRLMAAGVVSNTDRRRILSLLKRGGILPEQSPYPADSIKREAAQIKSRSLAYLATQVRDADGRMEHVMPLELEVASAATQLFMPNNFTTGTTIFPSGGSNMKRLPSVGPFANIPEIRQRAQRLKGETVILAAEALPLTTVPEVVRILLDEAKVGQLIILTKSDDSEVKIMSDVLTRGGGQKRVKIVPLGSDGDWVEAGLRKAMAIAEERDKKPAALIALPLAGLPEAPEGPLPFGRSAAIQLLENHLITGARMILMAGVLRIPNLVIAGLPTFGSDSGGKLELRDGKTTAMLDFLSPLMHSMVCIAGTEMKRVPWGPAISYIDRHRVDESAPKSAAESARLWRARTDSFINAVLMGATADGDLRDGINGHSFII